MSTNAKKRKSLRERRKIQRRKLQIRAAAALLSLVAVTFLFNLPLHAAEYAGRQ